MLKVELALTFLAHLPCWSRSGGPSTFHHGSHGPLSGEGNEGPNLACTTNLLWFFVRVEVETLDARNGVCVLSYRT